MGSITPRGQREAPAARPTVPRNVDAETWIAAHSHRQDRLRVKLEDLPPDVFEVASDPTPAEITEACRKIRRGWDARERGRRKIGLGSVDLAALEWLPPIVADPMG